jgi:CheY-like chemotaxis protein
MMYRILLVDDEPSIRVVLSAVLEDAGFTVDVAEHGFDALRKIQGAVPDLVITDLRMPNMNGFELLAVLRERFPQLPTIVISGEFMISEVNSSIADAFFQKGNYSIPDFLGKIRELLAAPRVAVAQQQPSIVWSPTGDSPVMLTCTSCMHSFPIDACEGNMHAKQTSCIFCGAQLEVRLVAIGVAPGAAS